MFSLVHNLILWGRGWGRAAMRMLAEYLENAIRFEQLAAAETDAKLKANLERQAAAYRKLAEKHAKEGLPPKGD
jgi:hypothetical protein